MSPEIPNIPFGRYGKTVRKVVTLIIWYFISCTTILLTKWLFKNYFANPLTVTTFSNTLTTVWAFLASRRPVWKPEPLTKRQFKEYVLPIGISTAFEIGFSNIALNILTVSFGTILKGSAPIFTMFWGLLLGIESFSANLFLSLFTIATGIALASMGEGQQFQVLGFILQLAATAFGGLRWAITHVLLQGNRDTKMPPLTATLYTSPTTAVCVLPFALILEGEKVLVDMNSLNVSQILTVLGTMTVVATLVFLLLISEYWLVSATSSLALSVAGVFKELILIFGAIIVFHDKLTPLNIIGFIVCQLGIGAYIWLRYDPNESGSADHGDISETDLPLTSTGIPEDTELEEDDLIRLNAMSTSIPVR